MGATWTSGPAAEVQIVTAIIMALTATAATALAEPAPRACHAPYHAHGATCHVHCHNGMSRHTATHGQHCPNPTPTPTPRPRRDPTPTPAPAPALRPPPLAGDIC